MESEEQRLKGKTGVMMENQNGARRFNGIRPETRIRIEFSIGIQMCKRIRESNDADLR